MNEQVEKVRNSLRWLPNYSWQRLVRRPYRKGQVHLMIALADHFEPAIVPGCPGKFAPRAEQVRRVEEWCREYPRVVDPWRDGDGYPFRHTYFYPAEQYDADIIAHLGEHCHAGWGEIEIHLHHGIKTPDTAMNTRCTLLAFRDKLVEHGCLSQWKGKGPARYAFVHGNWALANCAGGRCCGVDNEMQILAETGCYADFTFPAAPSPAQIAKINALYECALPLSQRAPHRRGMDLRCGQTPQIFPLIIQGPLGLKLYPSVRGLLVPKLENSEVTAQHPPTRSRLHLWRQAAISVRGKPDWLFVKLHCHGMDPRDREVMLGEQRQRFLQQLTEDARQNGDYYLHFVTAREMVNIILAACQGCDGSPGLYRDYCLQLMR